ncbi:hypothetical protein [Colwellia sp. E2M01]|uniref:hypothetical protein n=1 Tax=Colwellia sp. E2M01 TaxID=2841561 RepID=UPI001C0A55D1|nr:hypothetical protein [Colwellia sp. E2M01]MBU2870746.1 hypothetical protein [Colwellia sp. E2M01]
MFTLLANPKQILSLCNGYSEQALKPVIENMTLTVTALSAEVELLLKNRSTLGTLLPQNKAILPNITDKEFNTLSLEQLLNNHSYLVKAVNTLCLTEAIMVKNNFIDCIESLSPHDISKTTLSTLTNNKQELSVDDKALPQHLTKKEEQQTKVNNISSIHLMKIKQRVAKAATESEQRRTEIKNKLNGLLTTVKKPSNITSHQA